MKLCANLPCMDSGEAGSLSIRPSASLAATKSATRPSLVTLCYKSKRENHSFPVRATCAIPNVSCPDQIG